MSHETRYPERGSPVAALFVQPDGIYANRPGVDAWPEARDARAYGGPYPVVCHSPCNLWTNMAAVNWARYGRQRPAWYPGGDDGGCFVAALSAVRRWGGVLEHPAGSHAWEYYGLTRPYGHGWRHQPDVSATAGCGGYHVCEVWQSAYGHRARKRTWLLYCGRRPPFELLWERKPGTHVIGGGVNTGQSQGRPKMGKREASATPPAFADELIRLAECGECRDTRKREAGEVCE